MSKLQHMQVIIDYSSEWYPPLDPASQGIAMCSSSSSKVNYGLFLSACLLPETKSGQDELFTFVYGWYGRLHACTSHVVGYIGYSDLTDSDEVSSVQITGWGSQLAGRIQGMTIQLKECLWGKNPIKYKERRNQGVSRCMEAEAVVKKSTR